MAQQKEITVDLAPDGSIKIEAHNFTGVGCEKATKFLEDALGAPKTRTRKPEYLREQKAQQGQTVRQ